MQVKVKIVRTVTRTVLVEVTEDATREEKQIEVAHAIEDGNFLLVEHKVEDRTEWPAQ